MAISNILAQLRIDGGRESYGECRMGSRRLAVTSALYRDVSDTRRPPGAEPENQAGTTVTSVMSVISQNASR
jgi:hypothetical protein